MIKKLLFQFLIGLFGVIALAGCGSGSKFDRQKWSYGDGLDYPLRDDIVEDLMANHQIKGLTYRQVIDSLGSPQRRDPLKFTYQLIDDSYNYGRKKPVHKKSLIVYFNKDSVVTRFEIYDHTDKEKKKK
ncbi:outer membrane protein assembly factor BamE [Mucilaginibacter sp. UR6-11]|uniref:outer membrane protein assembly factor BamE n=1 Tax=Mucilaginibacter sp. UR6-11 TaxID=1435644 RepID=UPI001E4E1AD4|nr:outer membrane protein assembly factor BamE [Mucilaginibacter sp. UR6-11]MCC8424951.1 outer membrane protein assembly factor BamE [Mucilaginibacter sp. UR6-11]